MNAAAPNQAISSLDEDSRFFVTELVHLGAQHVNVITTAKVKAPESFELRFTRAGIGYDASHR